VRFARHPAVSGLLYSQIQDELQERVHDPEADDLPARHELARHTGGCR
jgi:DNA-binding GntR family transcriptional regulator